METNKQLNAVLIGCGYIAYYYGLIASKHDNNFKIIGCYDIITQRMIRWAEHFGVKTYKTIDEAINEKTADIIINLTPPDQHFLINQLALQQNKHIYCEKPLATTITETQELLKLAKQKNRMIGAAPCSVLTDAISKICELINQQAIGQVRFVTFNMHDFRIDLGRPDTWINPLGVPWPYKNEFQEGCTREHSAYSLAIATTLFGPVSWVGSLATTVIPEKKINKQETINVTTPDFTVSILKFANGIVGQLTCGIISHIPDRSIIIQGDIGYIKLDDCWNYNSPVTLTQRFFGENGLEIKERHIEFNKDSERADYYNIDQARGITNLCNAIQHKSILVCGNEHAAHVTELTNSISQGIQKSPQTQFERYLPEDIFNAIRLSKPIKY
ncbi:MAG: Gfo/Idh/MocA family oxidoreductase [Proteobacteria bacterium]|nr:Gfo/Idh/MocA family oxidoreductase [Pseudomonadota bacterium]